MDYKSQPEILFFAHQTIGKTEAEGCV